MTMVIAPTWVPSSAVEVLTEPGAKRLGGSTRTARTSARRKSVGGSSGSGRGGRTYISGPAPLFVSPRPGVDSYEDMNDSLAFLGFYVDILL